MEHEEFVEFIKAVISGDGNEVKKLMKSEFINRVTRPGFDEQLMHTLMPVENTMLLKLCAPLHYAAFHGHLSIILLLCNEGANVNYEGLNQTRPIHFAALNGHLKALECLIKRGAVIDPVDKADLKPIHYAAMRGHRAVVQLLIEQKADTNSVDFNHLNSLHYAAMIGHRSTMEILLKHGVNQDSKDKDQKTPMHYASLNGHLSSIRLLVDYKADVNCVDYWNRKPIHYASMNGHNETIEFLRSKGGVTKCFDIDERNPMHYAAWNGHMTTTKLLLDIDSKLNCADKEHRFPIHYAAMFNRLDVTRLLTDKGFETNCVDNLKMKPIHYATMNGHVEIMKLLMPSFPKEKSGLKLIHYAAWHGHEAAVKFLLDNKADPNCEDRNKRKPIHYAACNGHVAVMKLLLDRDAELNCADKDQMTPIHYVAKYIHLGYLNVTVGCKIDQRSTDKKFLLQYHATDNRLGALALLLDRNIDPNCANNLKVRPIHFCSTSGIVLAMEMLMNKGADINLPDHNQMKPIHLAALYGHTEAVRWLLDHGADPNCKNINLWTPLHFAARNSHTDVIQILLCYKASPNVLDKEHCRPMHYAAMSGCLGGMKMMSEHGADTNYGDYDERKPIHYVAMSGNMEALVWLVQCGADPNSETIYKTKPIHYACRGNHVSTLQWLVDYGCSPEAEDKMKWRPLHYACYYGSVDVVKWLASAGCVIEPRGQGDETPMMLAAIWPPNSNTVQYAGCINILQAEQTARQNNEYEIFHFPTYSIISRIYEIYDLYHTKQCIFETIPVINQTVVICHLRDLHQHLPPSLHTVKLSSESFRYCEYIVCDEQEDMELLKSRIKTLRDWDVCPVIKESKASLTKLNYRSNISNWSEHNFVNFTLHDDHRRTDKGAVNMLQKKSCSFDEIKTIFIDFSNFIYAVSMQKEVHKKQTNKGVVMHLKKRQLLMRKHLLTFHDGRNQKLSNRVFAEKFDVAKDEQIMVVQKSVSDIRILPTFFPLTLDKENNQKFVSKDYVLVICITDDQLAVAVLRKDYHKVDDLRQKISEICPNGNLVLVDQTGIINSNTLISDVDDVIYYASVLPYQDIEQMDKIGKGGYGKVYKCKIPKSSDHFALKKIKCKEMDYNETRIDIKREILVAARIGSHENIMKYRGFYDSKSAFYILMDLMKESLSNYLCSLKNEFKEMIRDKKEHPLGESKILCFAKQILEGLKYLHDHKIIHRDLKGSNVLMSDDCCLKLTDFGVSKCLTDRTDKISTKGAKTTEGTSRYMAPEIFALAVGTETVEAEHGLKVDVWSFGATMVEIITGSRPYPDLIDAAAIYKIGTYKTIEYEYPATLSHDLKLFVGKCLQSNPSDRPDCAKLLSQSLFSKIK